MRFNDLYKKYEQCLKRKYSFETTDRPYPYFIKNSHGIIEFPSSDSFFISSIKLIVSNEYAENFTKLIIYDGANIVDTLELPLYRANSGDSALTYDFTPYSVNGLYVNRATKIAIEHTHPHVFNLFIDRYLIKKTRADPFHQFIPVNTPIRIAQIAHKLFDDDPASLVFQLTQPQYITQIICNMRNVDYITLMDNNYSQIMTIKPEQGLSRFAIDENIYLITGATISYVNIMFKHSIDNNYYDVDIYLSCLDFIHLHQGTVKKYCLIPNKVNDDNNNNHGEELEIINTTRNPICPISQDGFENGMKVARCPNCNVDFSHTGIMQWFRGNWGKCPLCSVHNNSWQYYKYVCN